MKKFFRKFIKNESGLTLVELLAVVVILGIIAAIAVPSIGGIIDNSKKDAHIANAEQMVSSVRLAQASDLANDESDINYNLADDLVAGGYIEQPDNPGSNDDYGSGTQVAIETVDDSTQYTITLMADADTSHIVGNEDSEDDDVNTATIEELREKGRSIISVDGEDIS